MNILATARVRAFMMLRRASLRLPITCPLSSSGYKPAYSDLLSKLEEINSKITLVDDTVIFKAGQTTESEFDAKV